MNREQPRISIGMPVYNGEPYLKEALDSLLAQTFDDFELIISDNASTDGTQETCRAYAAKDKRIRYYRNEKNLGAAWNYNCVFELSTGEYFKWAAHDDVCAPEFLAQCLAVLDCQPAVSLCYTKTKTINEYGEPVESHGNNLNLCSPKAHKRLEDFFKINGRYHPHQIFGVIRADVLRKTGLHGNYVMSDRVLLAQLVLLGEFYELPEYLFYRRVHPRISTKANTTDAALAVWFDPQNQGKILLPRWRRYFEYYRTISNARIDWRERGLCYIKVVQLSLLSSESPRRWWRMTRELTKALKDIFQLELGQVQTSSKL